MRDRSLAIGFIVSVLLHAAGGYALGLFGGAGPQQDLSRVERDLPVPRIKPGSDDARAQTMTWIGYDDRYRPHNAREASVDQAAFERGRPDVGPPAPQENQQRQPPPEPRITQQAQPTPQEQTDKMSPEEQAAALRSGVQRIGETLQRAQAFRDRLARGVREAMPDLKSIAEALPQRETNEQPERETESAQTADAADSAEQASAPPAPEQPAERGNADRESAATAIEKAVSVDPGRPISAEGLRVETVRPRFAHVTRALADPRDMVVRVHFKRDGRVKLVDVLQSSGNRGVDEPVVDAVYSWKAEGEPLKSLDSARAGETVAVVFRIVL